MIVHILLGSGNGNLTAGEETELDEGLTALGTIASVQSMTFGRNFSGRSLGYTHGAVLHFADRDALQAYLVDPTHVAVVAVLNRLLPNRLVLDYDTESSGNSA